MNCPPHAQLHISSPEESDHLRDFSCKEQGGGNAAPHCATGFPPYLWEVASFSQQISMIMAHTRPVHFGGWYIPDIFPCLLHCFPYSCMSTPSGLPHGLYIVQTASHASADEVRPSGKCCLSRLAAAVVLVPSHATVNDYLGFSSKDAHITFPSERSAPYND